MRKPPEPQLRLPDGIDRAGFLSLYWQQRPLLMRSALAVDAFSLGADELAGLACEPGLESRLLVEQPQGTWDLRHGPFSARDFSTLPESHWTLLVQDVDKYLPEVARLIDAYDFVPDWRIDDIMISYAVDQGSVGPHSDAYDVFLMQAQGRRRWRISESQYTDADLIPHLEQRILSRFDTDREWVLEPGDVLYLPPGVAHWGIAEGPCMTYSLGFRVPNQQELAADWFQHLVTLCDPSCLLDPDDPQTGQTTQLSDGVFENAARTIDALPGTHSVEFRLWLGAYLTEPKAQFQIEPPAAAWDAAKLENWLREDGDLHRHPFARFAWTELSAGEVVLFCHGQALRQPDSLREIVRLIAQRRHLQGSSLLPLLASSAKARELLLALVNRGFLEPGDRPR